jgi:hypothetical protein
MKKRGFKRQTEGGSWKCVPKMSQAREKKELTNYNTSICKDEK